MKNGGARVIAAVVVIVVGLMIGGGVASAHSVLLESAPSAGGTVAKSPTEIKLTFNEAVEIQLGAIRLFDSRGRQINLPAATYDHGRSEQVVVPLPTISDGSYVVSWRVVSSDSHPVNGAFTFAVGTAAAGSDTRGLVARLVDDTGSPTVGVVLAATRWITYLATSVALGGLIFLGWCFRPGWSSTRTRRRLTVASAIVGVASLISIGAQGAYGAGEGIGSVFSPSLWVDVASTRFGNAALARVLAAAVLVMGLRALFVARSQLNLAITAIGAAWVIASLAAANHGLTGRWIPVAFLADVVHLVAMSIWLGGLVALAAMLRRSGRDSEVAVTEAVAATRKFSALAMVSVVALVITGSVEAIRQVGSPSALTSTAYGTTLLVKVGIVAVVVSVAWVSRRLTHVWADSSAPVLQAVGAAVLTPGGGSSGVADPKSDRDGEGDEAIEPEVVERETRRFLRRSVLVEVAMILAVLVASTILSNTIPAIEAVAIPFNQTVVADDGFAAISVTPARVGTTEVHVTVTTANGSIPLVDDMTVSISLPERDVGPLDIPMDRYQSVPNHFVTSTATFPFAGTWTLVVRAKAGRFNEQVFTVHVPVR